MAKILHTHRNQALPAQAGISLSADGRDFILHFDQHSVTIPCSKLGLTLMREQLRARAIRPQARTVSTPGALTQALVDRWLKDNKVKRGTPADELGLVDLSLIDL